jgi:hypothetical protein
MNMENLNESIKKILLNIQYDNNFTLSENYSNVERLNEAPRFNVGAAREADVIKGLGKTLDELLAQLKFKKLGTGEMKTLLAKDSENFVKELEKAALKDLEAGVAIGKIGDNLKEVGKIDFMRRVSEKVGNMKNPRKLSRAEMQALENESRIAQMEIMATVKPKGPKPAKPPVPPVVPPPPPKPRTIDVLKKWGGYAGIAILGSAAVYALFNWLNGKGNDSELLEVAKKCGYDSVEEFQAANFKCPKGGDVVVPPTQKKYRDCENETVQTYGCKSSLIRQVQDCLGVVIDGLWGPKTNTAISANASKFLGGFTKDDIKEICSSSSNKITDKTDREKIIDPQDVGAGLSSSTTTSDSTKSTGGGRTSPSDKASFYNPNLMD